MAAVHGPIRPTHSSRLSFHHRSKSHKADSLSHTPRPDYLYGHDLVASISSNYVEHLFQCPLTPPNIISPQAKLPHFIAYALHRTKLHYSVCFAALVLLSRLKARFPSARGSSGHRLFISAFMIASKVMCDDTYSNKSWVVVAQGLFTLREINQMEHEMVNYLDWELVVDPATLTTFEAAVTRDFAYRGPPECYPRYPLTMVSKRARDAGASSYPPHVKATVSPSDSSASSPISPSSASSLDEHPPVTPPGPSYSDTTSPTNTMSPETPIGDENIDVAIEASHDDDLCMMPREVRLRYPRTKTFAQAVPAHW